VYAIIEDGGRQFKVGEGEIVRVDLRDLEIGGASGIEFDRVLLVADGDSVTLGTPLVEGAKVEAEILRPKVAAKKLRVFKYKRRKGSRRSMGHRQKYTEVRITRIVA
jgi:large subunit ribosomal protein L21